MLLSGLAAVLVLYACDRVQDGFGPGGNSHDDDWVHDDTGDEVETGAPDSAADDTADSAADDTGDTSQGDTAPPFTGEGYDRGDVAYNPVAPDQNGQEWRLYQHSGAPVVLVFGFAQSYNFQQISAFLPSIEEDYSRYGLRAVAVMFTDALGVDADAEDAAAWAATYDLDTVLYDPDATIRGAWCGATQVETYLIDGDMVIRWTNLEATTEVQLSEQIADLVY
jgi:hypothetical protein